MKKVLMFVISKILLIKVKPQNNNKTKVKIIAMRNH